jgi:hypothetical protein
VNSVLLFIRAFKLRFSICAGRINDEKINGHVGLVPHKGRLYVFVLT